MTQLTGRVLAAYLTVCLIWGSTYLAIRIGVEHLPPAIFGGIRFLTAGLVLLGVALALGRRLPRRRSDWTTAAIVGVLLLGIGNGLVIWAEQFVESGVAAILVVTGALWMAVLDAVIPGSESRPTWRQFAALLLGFAGTVWLVGSSVAGLTEGGVLGPLAVVAASFSWALGSIYSKRHPVETAPFVHAALQMLAGGALLAAVGLVQGEVGRVAVSRPGVGALLYLIVFGSIVAYTAYVYLLKHAVPSFIGTHVYVNTIVAVLLGWAILSEQVTVRTFLAMSVILVSVVWVRRETRLGIRKPLPLAAEKPV